MLRILIIGSWLIGVTLGATYVGSYFRSTTKSKDSSTHDEKLAVRQIKVVTVPIIEKGSLLGYVSVNFSIVAPAVDPHGDGLDPESFILDEAFRMIYSENNIDFSNIRKQDLSEMTQEIVARVNKRLGKNALKELLVRNVNFIARDEVQK